MYYSTAGVEQQIRGFYVLVVTTTIAITIIAVNVCAGRLAVFCALMSLIIGTGMS